MAQVLDFIVVNRVRMATALLLVFAVGARPSCRSIAAGLPVLAFGAGLRVWAAGYLARNVRLSINGPYRYCRNPLYLGTALEWAGLLIMSGQPVLWLAGAACYVVLYIPAIRQEERILAGLFGLEYARYCRSVPRLVPRSRAACASNGECFSWRQVCVNREYLNFAAVLVAALLIMLHS